jgi:hypothetical protein
MQGELKAEKIVFAPNNLGKLWIVGQNALSIK